MCVKSNLVTWLLMVAEPDVITKQCTLLLLYMLI